MKRTQRILKRMVPITFLLMLSWTSFVYASSVVNSSSKLLFSEFKIYGSKYVALASGRLQSSPYTDITVVVDNMYKTDGSSSSYKTSVWGAVRNSTNVITVSDIKVTKGTAKKITIGNTKEAGVKYTINVKGNSSDINALISGNVKNFNKS